MALVLITPPAAEPLTPAEVRTRLGLSVSDASDAVLTPLITAARQEIDGIDGWLGRALITQTVEMSLDRFEGRIIIVPLPPLQSVVINYDDRDAVEQTLAPSAFRVLAGDPGRIEVVDSWPSTKARSDAVRIRFVAGYGESGASVPEPIRQALAEKVSLARMSSRPNPSLRSDTVDGVGSQTWSTGSDFADALRSSIDGRLEPFRIWTAQASCVTPFSHV